MTLSRLQAALDRAVELPSSDDCLAAIQAALAAGADVHARDSEGRTALHRAVRQNPGAAAVTAALRALLAAGSNVWAKANNGREPLQVTQALRQRQRLCVRPPCLHPVFGPYTLLQLSRLASPTA